MFKSAGCHQTGKIFENALWQNVFTQSPQVLFDRMNYTDHLGNIRLSYTTDPFVLGPKILEENNYYPFGLKHGAYNLAARDFRPIEDIREIEMVSDNPYNYKYQGQERQDELGLNWDSFKWRNYDYALGRFMSIDPLAESYNYQSPYNFAENRVVDGNELEGLEWSSHTDEEGIIHLILRVNPVNNSTQITDAQMNQAMDLAEIQFANTFSGTDSEGNKVIATMITDTEATISIEFNDVLIDVSDDMAASALGHTKEIGNTQENIIQIHVGRHLNNYELDYDNISKTLLHEKGHTGGLKHVSNESVRRGSKNHIAFRNRQKGIDSIIRDGENNLLDTFARGNNIVPYQLDIINRTIINQQP